MSIASVDGSQPPELTFTMDVKSYWARARSTPPAVVLVVSASLGAIGAFMPTAAAQQARTQAQDRSRLLELQRHAVTQLQQAARPRAPIDQVRGALREASRSLEGLSAGPSLDSSLQGELRRAASTLI